MSRSSKFGTLRPADKAHRVQVCCRFRPLNRKELKNEDGSNKPMEFRDNSSLKIYNPRRIDTEKDKKAIQKILAENKKATYNFDRVFDESSTQEDVYGYVGKPMIKELMDGYNCTIFTYGQTSCLDPDQKVLMYDGSKKKAKDVKLGDQLMGDDSKPRNVLELFEGEDEMYEVIPKKGESYRVNQNHLLTLRYSPISFVQWCEKMNRYKVHFTKDGVYKCKTFVVHKKNVKSRRVPFSETKEEAKKKADEFLELVREYEKIIDIPVKEYVKKSKSWKKLYKGVRTGVEFSQKEVDVDPYLLGLWLGDKSKSNIDPKVIDYVKSIAGFNHFGIFDSNLFQTFLKDNHLSNNKHIPKSYLINDRKIRLKVLAGLLDSDGYYDKKNNTFKITQKKENLINDIVFLSRSLKFSSYKKEVTKSCIYKGERKSNTYYQCIISGDRLGEIPTIIPRKKARNTVSFKSVTPIGISVKPVGLGRYNGFMLDGNHRFLLDSFDITHNSGKTHSMFGFDVESKQTGVWKDTQGMGIIPRAINDVFAFIEATEDEIEFTIKVSFLEIYLEKVRDLLNPSQANLKIRETRDNDIYVDGLKEIYVNSFEDILALIRKGQKHRVVAETKMNQYSSRSHSLLMLRITQNNLSKHTKTKSKLVMIDLAGSEKVKKSGAEGLTLTQVKHINKSLLMLGNVIHAITEKESHIPYRDSKLTRLLQDSIGGNAKTCLLITCSPSWFNLTETVSTLNFGARAKRIENKPRVNKELTVADYRRLMNEANQTIKEQAERIKILEAEIEELLQKVREGSGGELKVDTELIDQLRSKINELDGLLLISKDNEAELKEQIRQHTEDMELKQDEIVRLQDNITEYEKKLQEKDQDFFKMRDQINQQLMEKKQKEIELFEQNLQLDELKREKIKLEEKNSQLEEVMRDFDQTKRENDQLKIEKTSLETQNNEQLFLTKKMEQTIQEERSRVIDLERSLDKLAREKEKSVQAVEKTSHDRMKEIEADVRRKTESELKKDFKRKQMGLKDEFQKREEVLTTKISTLEGSLKNVESKLEKSEESANNLVQQYEKKFASLKNKYSTFTKQYDRLKDDLKVKMEENLVLQMEKEQLELRLQGRRLERENLEVLLDEKMAIVESEHEKNMTDSKREIQRKNDEVLRLQNQVEEVKHEYDQAKDEHKNLERQVRRLRMKNAKLMKKMGHPDISVGDLSEASSMDAGREKQFNSLRKQLKKMREYNLYIRGREKYYVQTIENRREHIEALEKALHKASQLLLLREQGHLTTIEQLQQDLAKCRAVLKEMGVPESVLGLGSSKIVVPLGKKSK